MAGTPNPNIDIFSSYSLTGAVNLLKPARTFIVDKVFRKKESHPTRNIIFGKSAAKDKLALFVNPDENPKLVAQNDIEAKHFELPITYEKKVFTAEKLATQKAVGEVIISNASSLLTNSNRKILEDIADLKNRVIRLREWMAIQAISEGKIEVAQDNISFKIDYNFVTGTNLITRSGNDLWTNTASNPVKELYEQKRNMARRGYQAKIAILGTDAADAFIVHAKVVAESKRQGYKIGDVNLTGKHNDYGNFLGFFAGLEVYEYSYQYTKADDSTANMLAAGKCVVIGSPTDMNPGSNAFRLHTGPKYRIGTGRNLKVIMDEYLMQAITNDNKTFLEWNLENCSLPAVHDPDAIVSLTVI